MIRFIPTRRQFLGYGAAAGLATPFLSRASFAQGAYAGQEFLVSLPDAANEKIVIDHVAPLMAERYGISLKTQQASSSKVLSSMRVQRRNPPALVVTLDLSYAIQALDEGLADPVSVDAVPNLSDVVPQATAMDGQLVSFILSTDTLVYNKDKWPTAPTSYAEMFTPERLPTTGIGSPSTNVGIEFLAAASSAATGKPISEAMHELKAGVEYLGQFRDQIRVVYSRAQEVMPMLASGDVNSCFVKSRFLADWIAREAPVDAVIPKEGAFYSLNCLVPVKGVRAPEMAMAYIDIMLSPEIQAMFPTAIGSAAVNRNANATIPPELANIVPTLADIDKLSLLPVLTQTEMEELNTLFNQVVAK